MAKERNSKSKPEMNNATDTELNIEVVEVNDQTFNDNFLTKEKVIIEKDSNNGGFFVHQIRTMRIVTDDELAILTVCRNECLEVLNNRARLGRESFDKKYEALITQCAADEGKTNK